MSFFPLLTDHSNRLQNRGGARPCFFSKSPPALYTGLPRRREFIATIRNAHLEGEWVDLELGERVGEQAQPFFLGRVGRCFAGAAALVSDMPACLQVVDQLVDQNGQIRRRIALPRVRQKNSRGLVMVTATASRRPVCAADALCRLERSRCWAAVKAR